MWHCVITVCRGSQSDCKVHLFVDQVDWFDLALIDRKVWKGRGVLGLARVPKDLEEGQGPCRKKVERKERRVTRGANTTRGEPPSYHGKNTHDEAVQRPDGRKEDSPSSRTKLLDLSRTTRSNVYPVDYSGNIPYGEYLRAVFTAVQY